MDYNKSILTNINVEMKGNAMIEIKFEDDKNRAAIYDGAEEIGYCTFSRSEKIWIIDHTCVSSAYGGQGLARKVVDKIIDTARERGIKIAATCPYALKVLKDEQYKDILA